MVEYVRARAPLRIGIAGGGTDVDPYASQKGGCVFNTTINKYAYCTITPRTDDKMSVISSYYGRYEALLNGGPLNYDGQMDLVKAVTNHFKIKDGFDMYIESDAPAGSGLGGSSTMIVAVISAFSKLLSLDLTSAEIAALAYKLERIDIGLSGGKQDQYAAAFGGFNLLHFGKDDVKVDPVVLDNNVINELQYRSVLCFTGSPRESATIIDNQIASFKKGSNEKALDETKRLAKEICDALKEGDIDKTGRLLDESWAYKKQFSEKVSNADINRLYDIAKENGAIGGKVSGAGGGGFMYYICKYDKKAEVANALKDAGAEVTEFMFDPKGVSAWSGKHE
ncbi:MAG: kinase [Candidatus Methanoplasma sp.]|jgi:D-glycero-alpha-D-manno-heptose-7-phosphate kinase|nr:kinase [Candidatus Methanoplasma sp.]